MMPTFVDKEDYASDKRLSVTKKELGEIKEFLNNVSQEKDVV